MSKAQGIAQSANQGQFKNRIINGNMVIDQRNAGASVSISGAYTLDRWYPSIAGGTGTIQRVAASLSGFGYAAQLVCGTGVTLVSFAQRIEALNCQDLASQTVTLSGYVYIDTVGSATGTVYLATPASGSSDNWGSGATYLTGQSITLTGGQYTYFSKTFTLPAGASNGVLLDMQFGSAASKTIRITGVQLEKGSTATSFDYRPYGTELALCQRYYEKISNTGNNVFCSGMATQATVFRGFLGFQVEKRTAPSVSYSSNGSFLLQGNNTNYGVSATGTVAFGTKGVYTQIGTTGMTQGHAIALIDGTGSYVDFSAEL
jgi:hypothetical protein